jgi:RNA polymerase sigma-70 factor (ECF subfamily)
LAIHVAAEYTTDPSWADVVRRIQIGDPLGMEQLYNAFATGIRFHLCRQIGPKDLDDHLHDLFLVIIQSILRGDLREPARLMGYVQTVMRRHVAAHIENTVHIRRSRCGLDQCPVLPDRHATPECRIMEQQERTLAFRLMGSLRRHEREILIRFYVREQEPNQICREMHLSDTQFRLIKSRAKARFGELGKGRFSMRRGFQPKM